MRCSAKSLMSSPAASRIGKPFWARSRNFWELDVENDCRFQIADCRLKHEGQGFRSAICNLKSAIFCQVSWYNCDMGIPYNTALPPDLRALKQEIEGYARGYGLDFYETIFEVLEGEDLNEVAAYGGFPTRYPHWSFGMSYEELRKGYDYGLSKIYE